MHPESHGRVAVVTGGAQSIGAACARRLARDGHRIAIADIAPADETEAMIRDAGGECFAARCDIADSASVAAFGAQVAERYGQADVLLACAGIYPVANLSDTSWELWRAVMSTNVDSLYHLATTFVPGMVERGWGRVIAISSTVFHTGTPRFAAYTTSKGAVIGFVRALATEVGPCRRHRQLDRPEPRSHGGNARGPAGAARLVRLHARAPGDQAHAGARRPRRRGLVLRLRGLGLHHRPNARRRRRAHAHLSYERRPRRPARTPSHPSPGAVRAGHTAGAHSGAPKARRNLALRPPTSRRSRSD